MDTRSAAASPCVQAPLGGQVDTSLRYLRNTRTAPVGLLVNPILVAAERVAGFVAHTLVAAQVGSPLTASLPSSAGAGATSRAASRPDATPLDYGEAESSDAQMLFDRPRPDRWRQFATRYPVTA